MDENKELQMLEDELQGINDAVAKSKERLELVMYTESLLLAILNNLKILKNVTLEEYNNNFELVKDTIVKTHQLAQKIPYKQLQSIDTDDLMPQGSISYNFSNFAYETIIVDSPKSPPISKQELSAFLQRVEAKNSGVLVQLSQIKSYKSKLERIINQLSVTAIASYLCS